MQQLRIGVLSDLHSEFWTDLTQLKAEIIAPYAAEAPDAMVLAGDIGVTSVSAGLADYATAARQIELESTLDAWCAMMAPCPVIYVAGNHEYVGTGKDPAALWRVLRNLAATYNNFYPLQSGSAVTVCSRRWLGDTGWYPETVEAAAWWPNWFDARYTPAGYPFAEHRKWKAWLTAELAAGDIVVTHMLPCSAAIAPRWRTAKSNCFFDQQLDTLIGERSPALWLFGHTHDSIDVTLPNGTRLYANPYGDHDYALNAAAELPSIITL